MSMGSDFSSGYGLGLDTKRVNQAPSFNPWPYLAQAGGGVTPSFRGGGYSRGGGGVPAKQILENARIEALKQKEADLKLKEADLKLTAQDIANKAAEQKMNQDRLKFMGDRTKAAEDRAQGLKTERYAADDRANVNSADQAIRGFYTKDKEPILNFINQNGSPEANAVDIEWGTGQDGMDDAGKVYIKFSDGRTVAYANDKDAIEKVIAPMAILQQDIKGRMTQAQQKEASQKDRGLDIREKRAGAYEKSVEGKGLITDKQDADLFMKAQSAAQREAKEGYIDYEEIDARADELYEKAKAKTGQNIDSNAGSTSGMSALPDPSQHKGRTVKDTLTGKRYKSDGKNWNEVK